MQEKRETPVNCLLMYITVRHLRKKIEARMIRCELRRQLLDFEADIREYLEMDDGEDKEDLYFRIRQELSNRSEYTAFKRWLILDHKEMCRDLLPLVEKT